MPIKKSALERQVRRAAFGIVAGEELGFVIEDLGGENTLWKATISATWAGVGGAAACAWPRVASTAWFVRLVFRSLTDSRPSHMTCSGSSILVVGMGRRYIERMPTVGLTTPIAGLLLHA